MKIFLKILYKFLFSIAVLVIPISIVITSPTLTNKTLDWSDFEDRIVKVYSFSSSEDSDLSDFFKSSSQIRKERIESVNNFHEYINEGKVPVLSLTLSNPWEQFKNEIKEGAESIIDDIKSYEICNPMISGLFGDSDTECVSINSLLNQKEGSSTDVVKEESKNITFETSLGINESNVSTVSTMYRFLKYLWIPFLIVIMGLNFTLMILNKSSIKVALINAVWNSVIVETIWWLFYLITKIFRPFSLTDNGLTSGDPLMTSITETEGLINSLISNFILICALVSLIIPVLIFINLGIYILVKKKSGNKIDSAENTKPQIPQQSASLTEPKIETKNTFNLTKVDEDLVNTNKETSKEEIMATGTPSRTDSEFPKVKK